MNYYDRLTTLIAENETSPQPQGRRNRADVLRQALAHHLEREKKRNQPINAGDDLGRSGSGDRLQGSALGARTRTTQVVGYRGSRRSATS